jgi:hypothetical protein
MKGEWESTPTGLRLKFGDVQCPKCKYWSGDDWKQCQGACPVEGSPHYRPDAMKLPPTNWDLVRQCELVAQRLRECEVELSTLGELRNNSVVAAADLDQTGIAAEALIRMLRRCLQVGE